MVVFVCSPYGGKKQNYEAALNYCRMEIEIGNIPYAPHVFFHKMLNEATERDVGISCGLEMLARSDALHVWSDEITPGMRIEIEHAEAAGIPVVYMGRLEGADVFD